MAKGDSTRTRNAIDAEQGYLGNRMDNLRFGMTEPLFNQGMANFAEDRGADTADRSQLMSGFGEFAKTGGFSPQDIADFRARAAAPMRSAYAGANREIDRSRALSGGGNPLGYGILKQRMARDAGQGMADTMTNANAAIAQMQQQGRLAGLSGGSSLFGTTGGRSALSSSNLNNAVNANLGLADLDVRRGLGILGQRNQSAQIPGNFQQGIANVGGIVDIGRKAIPGASAPWGGG